jgi:MoxR-like ATPase
MSIDAPRHVASSNGHGEMLGLDAEEFFVASQAALNFRREGMSQLGHILYDNSQAKRAVLAGYINGPVLLAGYPGGAKTTLAKNVYRLVSDIDREDISRIPIDPQLRTIRLVGGQTVDAVVERAENGEEINKEVIHTIKPIVKPDVKIILADEINRLNQEAMNSLLSAPEEGLLETTEGTIALDGLQLIIATMNPSGSHKSTSRLDPAWGSRFVAGAISGEMERDNKKLLFNGRRPDLQVRPVITTKHLALIRKVVNDMELENDILDIGVYVVEKAIGALATMGIKEEDGRMIGQVGALTKTLFLLGDSRSDQMKELQAKEGTMSLTLLKPSISHLREALTMAVTARVGAFISDDPRSTASTIVEHAFKSVA